MKATQDSELTTIPASDAQGQTLQIAGLEATNVDDARLHAVESRSERLVQASFIWPALLVVLVLSIFPLIISLYLSLSHLEFVKGGFRVPLHRVRELQNTPLRE